ncbi:hypothetical protein A2188_01975 [Candidatus Woesebacteria bacterium RIFOXYA1_FULL_43_9]|uniref:Glycosyltransferase 2-like domain-containing protein n=1 Tax=Candidatus Woesebacteria bacterium RIFOXYA1_FULL_43_9 TaxID=1802534 RepID=A0A1F8CQ61_9BACT|nr:MAG: hypothetical protein A2188_01975 [Candidatus Woesebacteria bacterium RIFOXYA1_FULL_43_9]
MKKTVSVILPCHNEAKNISLIVPEIIKNIPPKYTYEVILIDDGSIDNTRLEIFKLTQKNQKIKGIIFNRNFGHQAAILAGLRQASGDAVISMDADFQHPPKLLPKFIQKWEAGHDLVRSQKITDKHLPLLKLIVRQIGYHIWNFITDGALLPGGSDFRLISKTIREYLSSSPESQIFLRGNVTLAAGNPAVVKYQVNKRKFGKSSYTAKMFLNMFINGFISFSNKPLRIASISGGFLFFTVTLFIIGDIIRAILVGERIIQGWITGMVVTIVLNAVIMIYLGILGEYIIVIFKEVKKRPPYLISSVYNLK